MAVTLQPTRPSAGFAGFIPTFWDSVFGENLYPSLFFYQFAAHRKVPLNFGTTIKIPRLKKQTNIVSTTPYSSGSYGYPAGYGGPLSYKFLCSQVVSGTLQKFAGVYANSDIVLLTSLGDPTELALRDIARNLALTIDTYARNTLSANTVGTIVCGGGTSGWGSTSTSLGLKSTAHLTPSDIARTVMTLDRFNNPRPPDGHYPLVIHPAAAYDLLQTMSSGHAGAWTDVNKYASDKTVENIYRGEIGRLYGARIVTSSNIKRLPGSAIGGMSNGNSGYLNMAFAPEAYYIAESEGMTARTIVKPLGSGGTFDPDNSLATVAAKVYLAVIAGFQVASTEYRLIRLPAGSKY